jgi:hypothetical protein
MREERNLVRQDKEDEHRRTMENMDKTCKAAFGGLDRKIEKAKLSSGTLLYAHHAPTKAIENCSSDLTLSECIKILKQFLAQCNFDTDGKSISDI